MGILSFWYNALWFISIMKMTQEQDNLSYNITGEFYSTCLSFAGDFVVTEALFDITD